LGTRLGVSIGTLDNPGWSVSINLKNTSLEEKPFTEINLIEDETEWISCRVKDGNFEGHGGPLMLEEILTIFLAWTEEPQPA
jgi:hypothetical protein